MRFPIALLTVLAVTGPAFAAELRDANAIIFGNMTTTGGHADGTLLVGGDWEGSDYQIRLSSASATTDGAGLMLGGDNNTSIGLRVLNGDAVYDGLLGTIDVQSGSLINAPVDLSAHYDTAVTAMNYFRSLTGTPLNLSDPNNINTDLNLVPEQNGYHVFSLNAADMSGNRTMDFQNADLDDVVVINVTGTAFDWNWTNNFNASRTLWTFNGADVNINSRHFHGSLLAPDADVLQNQNFNGTLIANSLQVNNSVELHDFRYLGPIPEPGTAVLALAGVLPLLRRQRGAERLMH